MTFYKLFNIQASVLFCFLIYKMEIASVYHMKMFMLGA